MYGNARRFAERVSKNVSGAMTQDGIFNVHTAMPRVSELYRHILNCVLGLLQKNLEQAKEIVNLLHEPTMQARVCRWSYISL